MFTTNFSPAFLSILGNAAVLIAAAWRHSVLKAPELLTVNLAVTDIGMALSMYPLSIASAFNHAWIGGDPSCLYYGLMGMIFSVASIVTLAVMGLVRYLATGNPPKSGTVLIVLGPKVKFRNIDCFIDTIFHLFCCIQAQKVNMWLMNPY